MSSFQRPRLRHFEQATSQRHIGAADRYLYMPPSPRHRLAVIGSGTIGQEHMRVASLLGRAAVHGIYDESAHSMTVAAEEFARSSDSKLVLYEDLLSACNDPDVDALMICTPNYTHFDVLKIAMTSGKPILLEKPMATTLDDAWRIVELAVDYPSFIQVGLQYRYKAPYVEARHEVLERRALGDVKTISMCEYRPPFLDKVKQWNKFSEHTGGTLVEKCCHYFDLINLFADSTPARVYASGGQAVNFLDFQRDGRRADIDDHAFVIIDYESGLRSSFTLNMFCPYFYEELVVCGDGGRLVASERYDFLQDDRARSRVTVECGEGATSRETTAGYALPIEQSGHHGATFFEHVAFVDRLEGKATDAATPLQGLWSIVVAAAAQASIASGQPVGIRSLLDQHQLGGILDMDDRRNRDENARYRQ